MTSIEFMVLPVSTGLIQENLGIEVTIPMALGPSSSYGACPGKLENGKALGPPSFSGACPRKLGDRMGPWPSQFLWGLSLKAWG